jgi:hypothetical protein
MLTDSQLVPPSCSECHRPMQLVSVLCSRADVQPPVQTFECADCETDVIWQWQPPPVDLSTSRLRR